MHPTHFRFSMDACSMLALELTATLIEGSLSEPWKAGCSPNDAEDGCTRSLDSYWIDIGGEG
jgi:hypothetical protein